MTSEHPSGSLLTCACVLRERRRLVCVPFERRGMCVGLRVSSACAWAACLLVLFVVLGEAYREKCADAVPGAARWTAKARPL